jgi:hypothetical protein
VLRNSEVVWVEVSTQQPRAVLIGMIEVRSSTVPFGWR